MNHHTMGSKLTTLRWINLVRRPISPRSLESVQLLWIAKSWNLVKTTLCQRLINRWTLCMLILAPCIFRSPFSRLRFIPLPCVLCSLRSRLARKTVQYTRPSLLGSLSRSLFLTWLRIRWIRLYPLEAKSSRLSNGRWELLNPLMNGLPRTFVRKHFRFFIPKALVTCLRISQAFQRELSLHCFQKWGTSCLLLRFGMGCLFIYV